jgi:acetolactate synthase-1/2/3 large subunit
MTTKPAYTIADRIAAYLAKTGIERVFVYPGGTIAPLINGFIRAGIRIEVFKHEQGAAYAALAVARLTGITQVVMVTSGPGATNAITPLADAFYDSTPLLLITGQIGTGDLCSGRQVRQRGFQEVAVLDLVKSISKAAGCPVTADEALTCMPSLLACAVNGRPGPVVLDFPMDVQRSLCQEDAPMAPFQAATPSAIKSPAILGEIAEALAGARRPVILLGHGALQSGQPATFQKLAEAADALVVCTLPGLGALASDDRRCLGFLGHTGHGAANHAVHSADFLLALGTRLDVRQTGTLTQSFVPDGKIAWIIDDPDELAFPRIQVDWAVEADLRGAVVELLGKLPTTISPKDTDWQAQCIAEHDRGEDDPYPADGDRLYPREVLRALGKHMAGKKGVVTTGVGSHQQWAARHLPFSPDGWRFLTSAGHGAMGYDLPSAIGAALACPGQISLCVVGDGSFLMNIQELASLAERALPVKILLLNNSRLGIVSQFQRITWGNDPTTGHFPSPDFVAIARGFGIAAERLDIRSEIENTLNRFWAAAGPALLEVIIDHDAEIVPMLLGGQTMDQLWQGHPA